jgi:hypothetical protein
MSIVLASIVPYVPRSHSVEWAAFAAIRGTSHVWLDSELQIDSAKSGPILAVL